MIERLSRYRGCMLGLATGDALGTTLEFRRPGSFAPLTDMVGGGPFNLQPGQWTDDTSMALCLAESLIECGDFHPQDQMQRYLRWWREGHLSSNGHCFDIGYTTSAALERFADYGTPFAGVNDSASAGNGSLMRLAPVPLAFAADPLRAITLSADSSLTTHATTSCVDACRYFAGLIVGALQGVSKEELLAAHYAPVADIWQRQPLCAEIDEIAAGSFRHKQPPEIVGSGHAVRALEAALWAFYHANSFEHGCLLAVNLGDDADTTGAIYGQIAGAYYGVEAIPAHWRELLAQRELIEGFAVGLLELADAAQR